MNIKEVSANNLATYLNLAQCYEAEFSVLTKKKPDKDGLFMLDTEIAPPTKGYIVYVDNVPAGIAAIGCQGDSNYEVYEFYIVPYFRNEKLGTQFAHGIWQMLPGHWVVKQIQGANHAINFWQSCIKSYPHKNYQEGTYQDEYWGQVNKQSFLTTGH
ncbi:MULTISPECIES: hypothetical protein [Pseudoalteromonas]|uniref:N-acetyltransferase domain-containing protein n=1 Tax=Pseudoalteromonas amylolytica TaxID=1859457 RepID=A0A1S1MQX4_9GAMM|nr:MULTISPECIES: hypothetical protein [Pseudoalteromonas]OHU86663.1 hypothetical protein BFC16_14250 [Pseudoalteromonas sp. JW3]OHU88813.1 hypothetical protein BET10_18505 [Pseudoalteromonas amylolytica]